MQTVTRDSVFNTLFRAGCGGWIAGDATYSVALPNGNTLWLFGDSFIGTALPDSSIAPGAHMIRNCGILQMGDSLQALFNGTFDNPEDFIPSPDPDSSWMWPEHGMVENDTLKLFMSEFITSSGQPGWNFEFRDTYLVFLTFPGLDFIDMQIVPYYQSNGVMYGNQLLTDGGYTYIYGRRDGPNNVANAHLARVPAGNLSGSWEFYSGSGWSSDPAASAWITFQSVSQQYAAFKYGDKYILLTQQTWLGPKIYTLTSVAPQGPWENLQEIYSTPLPFPDMFTYNAWAHPQFNENDELLVSYNSNGDFWSIFNNVELYRPTFLRVPFQLIDTTFYPAGTGPPVPLNPDGILSFRLYPNPASEKVTLEVELVQRTYISLDLFNRFGIRLATLYNGELSPGHHEFPVDLDKYVPGIYYLRVGDQVKKLIRIE